jgi:nicotinamide mononucleotide (NMN) deamidase PncC
MIERIHKSGRQLVIAVTGGASRAISDLLSVPGASASVLDAAVPYSLAALESWLGGKVDHACSERTARAMAMAAFERARALSAGEPQKLVGVGVTASLVSIRTKRGPHRVHVAWQSATVTVAYSLELAKGERSRADEENVAAALALAAIAEACDADADSPADLLPRERVERREKQAPSTWSELLLGTRDLVLVGERGPAHAQLIFPGAFNPIHEGHRRMAEIAAARLGETVLLELSIANVDKPPIDFLEIDDRLQQLAALPVALTRAATFVEKAALFPGATFVVGADTISRIADPVYYANSVERRDAAIAAIAARGCRFLVFGRTFGGQFAPLNELNLPVELRVLCKGVSGAEFRDDSSSTAVRSGDGREWPADSAK